MPTAINGARNEESSQSLIADLSALFDKQKENLLNLESESKKYEETITQPNNLSGTFKQILSARIEVLKQNGTLPPYQQALFEQALVKASEVVPENVIVHPMKFKLIYQELLKAFDQIPGFNEAPHKIEAILISHNLTVEMSEDNKNTLIGIYDSNHFLKMLPDNFENPKQAFKAITNVIQTIDDEISQLNTIQEKMSGSDNNVKDEVNHLLSDADSRLTTFEQPINERVTELTTLKNNLMVVKQQVADNMVFRSDEPIEMPKADLPLPQTTMPMQNSTTPEVRPQMKGLS